MEQVYVESAKTGIIYVTDLPIYEYLMKNKDFLEFPELIIKKQDIITESDYVLSYINSSDKDAIFQNNKLIIQYPQDEVNCNSIIYPGYMLIENKRLLTKEVTCHSACITKDNKAILFLGRTGSGKTCLTLNMCINNDFNLIANDSSILKYNDGKIYVTGGTKFVFLRYESIKRNLPFLLDVFNNRDTDMNYKLSNNIDTWRKKVRVLPYEIGVTVANSEVEIVKVYMVHIDENQKVLYNNLDNSLVSKLFLNEVLSENIRGVKTTFFDKNYNPSLYIPSMDTKDHYNLRQEIIASLLNDCEMEYISGNINAVSEKIEKDFQLIKRYK